MFFKLFKKLPLTIENYIVSFNQDFLEGIDPRGKMHRVYWDDLCAIAVHKSIDYEAPMFTDQTWVFMGSNSACLIPNQAQGFDKLLQKIQQLSGFQTKTINKLNKRRPGEDLICWHR